MVDPIQRRRYARLLRALATGRLTNDEYEEAVEKFISPGFDPAISAIHDMAWYLYDDLHEHRLQGRYALTREGRREVARWLLFLYSDQEYSGTKFRKNPEAWPFANKQELDAQTAKPVRFFCGKEALPEGLGPLKTGRLEAGETEERFPFHPAQSIWVFILGGMIWAFLKWRSFNYSLKPLPSILLVVGSVIIVMSLPQSYKPLKWWQIPLALAALAAWLALFVYIA